MLPREKSSLRSSLMRFYPQYQIHISLNMCHLEERKSHSCVFWNGDQRTYSLTSPKMCNNITLLTKTELSDSNISNILLRRCQNIPNVLLVLFSDNLACWDRISIKLLPSSSFVHTCVQVCPRRRIRPEVSFIAISMWNVSVLCLCM